MMRVLLFALCAVAEAVGAIELQGRLFFTPAQRAQLETARAQKDRQQPSTEGEVAVPPAPEIVTYGGIVRRNDGKSTVWLNNRPISDRKTAAEAGISGVRADGAITVRSAQSERSVALKVGQRLDVTSGVIEEPYARVIARPDAKPATAPTTGATDAAARKGRARDDAPEDADLRSTPGARSGRK